MNLGVQVYTPSVGQALMATQPLSAAVPSLIQPTSLPPPPHLQLSQCLQASSPPRSQGHNCVRFNCPSDPSPVATPHSSQATPNSGKASLEHPAKHDAFRLAESASDGTTSSSKQSSRKRRQASSTSDVTPIAENVTTLMIRNIPAHLTQAKFLEELNRNGFAGTYDFAYMPQSFDVQEGKGFAFVNFMSPASASALSSKWHRQCPFETNAKSPALNISAADIQGLEDNLRKWNTPRLRRIRNPNLRPFVVEERSKALRSLVPR